MRRSFVIPVLALLVALLIPINPLFAQQAINGTIRGRISDPSGAAVAGADVTVTNTATGFTRSITTGDDGYYVLPNLPLGTYSVTVKKSGFQTLNTTNVSLAAGSEAVVDGELKVGQVETTVEVTGGAPVVEPARTNIGRTITEHETQNLPLTSRNPYNFIVVQPGVSGHPNPELGIPRTLNTNGQLDRINYQMDGMVDTQSDRHGLRLFPISDVYVREVQAVTNSFAPEYGNTTGDIFNVITNSGTNDFHGQALWAHRWLDATAEPMLSPSTTPKTSLNDYAFNAGGPLIKNKLFLFAGYEHLVRGVASPITISSANATALGIPSSELGASPGLLHGQFFNIRGDWTINNKNQFFLRYNYFRNEFPINTASSGGGAPAALSSWSDFKDRAHVVGAQLVTTISPTVLNELRGGWAYRNNLHFPGAQTGPGPVVIVNGVAIFNGTNAAGDRFNEKAPNWNDNLTWIRGTHTYKFGVTMTQYVDLQRNVSFIQYQFPSVAAYQAAQAGTNPYAYTTFSSSQDPIGVHYRS
ncbi:MAG TPA: carboxypeptidase-like regulatory domain-containing protein, partial [Terriglobales bacterium]|nr:carboxypeptidase-like regulatory domain-containing protein [Terriglobales bacterium]